MRIAKTAPGARLLQIYINRGTGAPAGVVMHGADAWRIIVSISLSIIIFYN